MPVYLTRLLCTNQPPRKFSKSLTCVYGICSIIGLFTSSLYSNSSITVKFTVQVELYPLGRLAYMSHSLVDRVQSGTYRSGVSRAYRAYTS